MSGIAVRIAYSGFSTGVLGRHEKWLAEGDNVPDCGFKWLAPRESGQVDPGISQDVDAGTVVKAEPVVQICILELNHAGSHRSSMDVLKPQ